MIGFFLFQSVMIFLMSFILMRVLIDGTLCPLKHKWDSEFFTYDIDLINLKVKPESYEQECVMCHKTRKIKPGSRKWFRKWEAMELRLYTDERWQTARQGMLLDEGYELDIITGEPVDMPL